MKIKVDVKFGEFLDNAAKKVRLTSGDIYYHLPYWYQKTVDGEWFEHTFDGLPEELQQHILDSVTDVIDENL